MCVCVCECWESGDEINLMSCNKFHSNNLQHDVTYSAASLQMSNQKVLLSALAPEREREREKRERERERERERGGERERELR